MLKAIVFFAVLTASTSAFAALDLIQDPSQIRLPDESGCGQGLTDDAYEAQVDASQDYDLTVSEPHWVVPQANLPAGIGIHASNNNVSIACHQGRLFMAWRSSPLHFAGKKTIMPVVSSGDFGQTWQLEQVITTGADMREPFLFEYQGNLTLHFFEAGTIPWEFQPHHLWRTRYLAPGEWTEKETWGDPGEIAWEFKERGGKAYMTSYIGNHYAAGKGKVDVRFNVSDDGVHWTRERPAVYTGGDSEVAFDFDRSGKLWAVARDEDGDDTGFGSHVATADPNDLGTWYFPSLANPYRYDSPRMFRHGNELYLVARRNVAGRFDLGHIHLPFEVQKALNFVDYSLTAKRTALYRIDRERREVVWLMDLPGDGDTAFPSILRTGPNTFVVANYTSPLKYPNRDWIWGQVSPQGTQIYMVTIQFHLKM